MSKSIIFNKWKSIFENNNVNIPLEKWIWQKEAHVNTHTYKWEINMCKTFGFINTQMMQIKTKWDIIFKLANLQNNVKTLNATKSFFFFLVHNLQVELQTGIIFLGMLLTIWITFLKEFMSFHAIILLLGIYPKLWAKIYMQKYLLHCCF